MKNNKFGMELTVEKIKPADNERLWIFPGSFDPFTVAHLDLLLRAAKQCDRLVIAVLQNPDKETMFSAPTRAYFIKKTLQALQTKSVNSLDSVEVLYDEGMLVTLAKRLRASAILRGLRNAEDLVYEQNYIQLNREVGLDIDFIFLMANPAFQDLSATKVRDLMLQGGNIRNLVPQNLQEIVVQLLNDNL